MALRAIVDLELNDGPWLKFQDQFAQYQKALADSKGTWDDAIKGIDGSRKSFDSLVAAAGVRLQRSRLIADAEKVAADALKRQSGETTTQARSWNSMAKDSKAFAGNVVSATKSLLQWAGVTTAISGLLGAGGLFGIDRLAQSVAGQRKDASGLRVTPGELRSFDLNFGRILDNPRGFLGSISESLSDVTKAAPYGALGLNYGQERSKAPADVAIDVLRAEKRLADRTPQQQLGNVYSSRQLAMLGTTLEDFQRIKDRPLTELEGYIRHNQADRKGLDLDQGQQKAWEDLKVQLTRAGDQIEKTFVAGLVKLTDPLERLSASFVKVVDAFAKTPQMEEWIDDLAGGLSTFADYIGTPKFKSDVETFADGVGHIADKIVSGLRLLGLIPGPEIKGGNDDKNKDSGGLSGLPVDSPFWRNVPDEEQSNYVNSPRSQRFLNPNGDSSRPFSKWDPSTWLHHSPGTGPALRDSPFPGGSSTIPGDPNLPRGIRNNNPLNLSYLPGQGAIGSDGRFGVYKTMEEGIAAEERQFLVYQDKYRLDTLGKVLNRWAPPSDNPAGYPQQISRMTGIDLNAPLNMRDPETARKLFGAMARVENGRPIDPDTIRKGVDRGLGVAPSDAPAPAAPQPYGHKTPDRSMRVRIENNTGGNAHISVSQLAV